MKIETKRLILRTPEMKDLNDLLEGVGNFDISKRLLRVPYPYPKKEGIKYLKKVIKRWSKKDKNDYSFFIELKSEKKVIGAMGLHKIDMREMTATTGSWINKKYWKKGFITETKIAINDFAFNKLKLKELKTEIFKENKASLATQKKMGYKFEGFRKKAQRCLASGKLHDVLYYGLTKNDWKKRRIKLIKKLNSK